MSTPALLSVNMLSGYAQPGDTIFVPGGVTPPIAYLEALQQDPAHSRGLHLVTSIAPGINNPLDPARLHDSARVTGLFMQAGLNEAQRTGHYRMLPLSYGGFVRHLYEREPFDLCVLQVTPPDARGWCSLGPSVEFAPLAARRSKRLLALINPLLPRTPGSVEMPYETFDAACDCPTDLPSYSTPSDASTRAIAQLIADRIESGSTVQMGLGKVPTALAEALLQHRGLRLQSGLLSDGLMQLAQAGALDPSHAPTACVLAGSDALYEWSLRPEGLGPQGLRLVGCEHSHDVAALAALPRFIAVNSALEVDLFGQCNLEHADGRAISGAGGAPDFARAAKLSPDGCSIVALNASGQRGTLSRIVAQLSSPSVASLSRVDVDLVITEHGVADLRTASVHERAEALIQIADPAFRPALRSAWFTLAQRL